MVTLGIDVSSTVCGYAFVDQSINKILEAGFVGIEKVKTPGQKVNLIISKLNESQYIKKIQKINVEAPLSGFSGGRMRTQIIVLLARVNAVVEYALSEQYKIDVTLVNATTARKKLFGKSRIKGVPPKQFVKDNIEKLFDLKPFEILNRDGNPDKRMDDVRDAIVLAYYK